MKIAELARDGQDVERWNLLHPDEPQRISWVAERLDDPVEGPKLRKEILDSFEKRDGPDKIKVANYAKKKEYNGKNLAQIAKAEGIDPVDVKRSYRFEQGFTYELNLMGPGDRHRDAFVAKGAK